MIKCQITGGTVFTFAFEKVSANCERDILLHSRSSSRNALVGGALRYDTKDGCVADYERNA